MLGVSTSDESYTILNRDDAQRHLWDIFHFPSNPIEIDCWKVFDFIITVYLEITIYSIMITTPV